MGTWGFAFLTSTGAPGTTTLRTIVVEEPIIGNYNCRQQGLFGGNQKVLLGCSVEEARRSEARWADCTPPPPQVTPGHPLATQRKGSKKNGGDL